MVIRKNGGQNVQIANVLDADLYITSFLNFQNHINITIDEKSMSLLEKGVIVHHKNNVTIMIMTMTKRYMHLWHLCLIMTKFLVDILVTVRN